MPGVVAILAGLAARWQREPDRARGGFLKLAQLVEQTYEEGQATATRALVEEWAREICDMWKAKGLDGFSKILGEYCKFSKAAGRLAERQYHRIVTKLGPIANRPAEVSAESLDQSCCDAVEQLISEIQGSNDRIFLDGMQDVLARWKAQLT